MIITERQLMHLITILHDSIRADIQGIFSINIEGRLMLYNNIMNQQPDEPIKAGRND